MKNYLQFIGLSKGYPSPAGTALVVDRFDAVVARGEFVSIIGHSGCGKSTVLSMAAGLIEPTSGHVVLGGNEVDGPGPDRAVVFQSPSLFPWMTAMENVMLGVRRVFPHATSGQKRDIAGYYLNRVGLGRALDKRASDLSLGMRQRVGIARAFALKPKLLLLDEPFGMLDSLTRNELQEVLLEVWASSGITAVMVTHDVDEALFLSDRVIMMTNGPRARVGEILEVPFSRPRNRQQVMEHPRYYELRESLIGFLEDRSRHLAAEAPAAPPREPGRPWYRQLMPISLLAR
jgi:nitrate/nitrite transport system ATP-binding protein